MNRLAGATINGIRELWANRMRSLLSMSGIILGVGALAVMLAVAEGMLTGFREFVSAQGGIERIAVTRSALPREQSHLAGASEGLTPRDAALLAEAVTAAAYVSPEAQRDDVVVRHERRELNARRVGCTPDFLGANRRAVSNGRFISDLDRAGRANVCVLGRTVADTLFPGNLDPLGHSVRLDGERFTVVGVLEPFAAGARRGITGERNRRENLLVCIPLETALARSGPGKSVTGIHIRVNDPATVADIADQVDTLLSGAHRGLRDFRVETNAGTLADFRKTERKFMFSLAAVAVVSLVVGGAGITNVMLASINERTREIGVRLALGARGRDIFIQFLLESAVVGALGGLVGLAAAFAGVTALSSVLEGARPDAGPVRLSETVLAIGAGFSGTLGLLAGVYPSLRASRLSPIEALRTE